MPNIEKQQKAGLFTIQEMLDFGWNIEQMTSYWAGE